MDSSCPCCGGPFHCGVDDAQPCACSTLKLDASALRRLRAQYDACLCLACLQTLAAAPTEPMPDVKRAGSV